MPADDALPMLSQTEVKAMLSEKFKKYNTRLEQGQFASNYEKVEAAEHPAKLSVRMVSNQNVPLTVNNTYSNRINSAYPKHNAA